MTSFVVCIFCSTRSKTLSASKNEWPCTGKWEILFWIWSGASQFSQRLTLNVDFRFNRRTHLNITSQCEHSKSWLFHLVQEIYNGRCYFLRSTVSINFSPSVEIRTFRIRLYHTECVIQKLLFENAYKHFRQNSYLL